MNIDKLGLAPGKEGVAILVGPNGAGKSHFLKALSAELDKKAISVVSNTARDRFTNTQGIRRISAFNSPRRIIKNAVADALRQPSARFYEAGAVLEYCGYRPRFGFSISAVAFSGLELQDDPMSSEREAALAFLMSYRPGHVVWIDQSGSKLSFSLGRDFASVLSSELWLRRLGCLKKPVQVHLERRDGAIIELQDASSGELSLISTLVFLTTSTADRPVFLIDEPENSLHPNWQREYVERVMTATYYRQPSVVIATHAPLIVTGALAWSQDVVSVFHVNQRNLERLALDASTPTSIEEVLWRAFDVVTPANHFVSEQLADLVTRVGQGQVTREAALSVVNRMNSESFDADQRAFFNAVVELIGKVGDRSAGNP